MIHIQISLFKRTCGCHKELDRAAKDVLPKIFDGYIDTPTMSRHEVHMLLTGIAIDGHRKCK